MRAILEEATRRFASAEHIRNVQTGAWVTLHDDQGRELAGIRVPVVYLDCDLSHRMMSTIRHNRARGEHGVLPMGEIVTALLAGGIKKEDVMVLLQMEEVNRLAEWAGMPEVVARKQQEFSKGWVPG